MLGKLFRKNVGQRMQASAGSAEAVSETASHREADHVTENFQKFSEKAGDVKPCVIAHYGIPSTSSVLAFDPIQSLLAIGTLDGRIKVIGGDCIEGLFVSPKHFSIKYLQFFENQGFFMSISSDNEIQIWDLEERKIVSYLQWESTLTAFASVPGSSFVYVGDEFGRVSVVHYNIDAMKVEIMPYYVPTDSFSENMESFSLNLKPVVGLLPHPSYDETRLLIAFQNGLLVLWDLVEDKIIKLKRSKDFRLGSNVLINSVKSPHSQSNFQEDYETEKEICSVCWICNDGSTLAIGYDDGDIILWSLTANEPCDAIMIQLSSSLRKLPVIVLKWHSKSALCNNSGRLFVYGGDSIGSEEVLTILSLDWSSGLEKLKCVNRVDLSPSGAFSDMVLVNFEKNHDGMGVIMLTSPGELHYYEEKSFARQELYCSSIRYPMLIPTSEPSLIASKLIIIEDRTLLTTLSKTEQSITQRSAQASSTWPLKGGIGVQVSKGTYATKSLYIAGYIDGSIRMWDSTLASFSFVCCIMPELKGVDSAAVKAPVSALEFCPESLIMAVGNEIGTVFLYNLNGNQHEKSLTVITDIDKKVIANHGDWPQCKAVFSILKSSVSTIFFISSRSKLAVGYKSGQVAMLDINAFSLLFLVECVPSSIKYTAFKSFPDKEVLLIISSDAHVATLDAISGIINSSHWLEHEENSSVISAHCLDGVTNAEDDLFVLCCKTAIFVYTLKAFDEVGTNPIRKIEIKNASWSTTFQRNDIGLIVLYETGAIEIRSLPNLEVIESTSLMEHLRWNFKINMERTCSSDNTCLIMINGNEVASISLFGGENDPKCLPSLHDHVLAAVPNKAEKAEEIKAKFSSPPFLKPSPRLDFEENVLELNIDDIEIDEPVVPLNEERESLFAGGSEPAVRSVEEIRAKYRKEDASTAAARARDRLVERQEKLERIGLRTEELKNGAEDFASMAKELAKRMENRKWWNF